MDGGILFLFPLVTSSVFLILAKSNVFITRPKKDPSEIDGKTTIIKIILFL